jgi:hypothetical protein
MALYCSDTACGQIGRLLDASKGVDATFLIKPLARFRKCADIPTRDIMNRTLYNLTWY